MLTHFGTASLKPFWESSVVCIGTFDGVHRGHAHVIGRAVSLAHESEQPCALVTFDRHPAQVLRPATRPPILATLEQNLRQFRTLGVSICLILPFDQSLAQTEAAEFANHVFDECLRAKRIVAGHDFAFGKDRGGTPEWLRSRYDTEIVPPFSPEGTRISSSMIREAVASGQVERACEALGRPFALAGVVVKGQQLGRTLGFPTANLARSSEQVVPGDGVYAGWAHIDGRVFAAATSVGMRPTVGGTQRTVEAYLLDYPGEEIYGRAMELSFVTRLRPEMHFGTVEEMVVQMHEDVRQTRERLHFS
ncbi:MAG: bifunctional riboflavin kinase/FAD synthetase [Fimbriimonadaceae bacterium]|nr:bifunctional riboflavin kinase/FAD synthetase [Fimbriimonadaceae bacterium]